jgi:hypothetical protein
MKLPRVRLYRFVHSCIHSSIGDRKNTRSKGSGSTAIIAEYTSCRSCSFCWRSATAVVALIFGEDEGEGCRGCNILAASCKTIKPLYRSDALEVVDNVVVVAVVVAVVPADWPAADNRSSCRCWWPVATFSPTTSGRSCSFARGVTPSAMAPPAS